MVPDLAAAEACARISPAERALLLSTERPIVLLQRKEGSPIASEVSPDTPLVGLMLPYTPLHHLLLEEAGRPLVMTSGNLSEEPIACGNAEAITRLSGIADGFLVHDREIESRCDDSVTRVIAGRPTVLRRSRGWVPRAIRVEVPFAEPVPTRRVVLAWRKSFTRYEAIAALRNAVYACELLGVKRLTE